MPAASLRGQSTPPSGREQIAEVLGQPVYRDEIRAGKETKVRDELHRLITTPIMQDYRRKNKAEIEPTETEISAATEFFDNQHRERIKDEAPKLRERLKAVDDQLQQGDLPKEQRRQLEIQQQSLQAQLDPPGRFFAVFVLSHWKFQRHLYQKYGGGRILWQQGGVEAFDAFHKWLEDREKQGDFKISDSKLRSTFYEYWTSMNHGAFLTNDKQRIQREFLEPEWMQKSPDR